MNSGREICGGLGELYCSHDGCDAAVPRPGRSCMHLGRGWMVISPPPPVSSLPFPQLILHTSRANTHPSASREKQCDEMGRPPGGASERRQLDGASAASSHIMQLCRASLASILKRHWTGLAVFKEDKRAFVN